jgi:hypothetical protein
MSTSIVASSRSSRELQAPYQQVQSVPVGSGQKLLVNGGDNNTCSVPGITLETSSAPNVQNYPDYRTYQFQPLEPVSKVAFDRYVGPTPESNWVVPGKLLVGAYPASSDDAETLDLITSILQNKVTKFVCLQQEVSLFLYNEYGLAPIIIHIGA